ncbi:MAG: MoxR family ATPase [Phycisphaerales bacterium]|nr:MoxR family ATPase [Phycisphaerales bacterium]|tara:strand:+ start:7633 stop:8697 length:1065 start_codon:yes stop_codon:yes gene_type:complete
MNSDNTQNQDRDIEESIQRISQAAADMKRQLHRVIIGQDEVIEQLLIAIFSGGHALVVGVPGLAKTLLIRTIAQSLKLDFSRIQFTPDLMPSDMTGTEVIEEDRSSGTRNLRFVKGPVFANIVLADEINRTPPKTQAALLEAMQERQVTAGGEKHSLPEPFFVLATQNPIEQEGTYPLPEAQLDRFMLNIQVAYPSENEELQVVQQTTSDRTVEVEPVLDGPEVESIQQLVRQVPVADHVAAYAVRLARSSRIRDIANPPKIVADYVSWGAGPRASQFLVMAAKAKALLEGEHHVTPDHIRQVAHPVLRHRILLNFNAEADGIGTDDVINELLDEVSIDDLDERTRRHMDEVTR